MRVPTPWSTSKLSTEQSANGLKNLGWLCADIIKKSSASSARSEHPAKKNIGQVWGDNVGNFIKGGIAKIV